MPDEFESFAAEAGLLIRDRQLLRTALSHSSWVYEQECGHSADNERLEYLGDAVLQLSVSTALFLVEPKLPEGRMSKVRSLLVCEHTLAKLARTLDLGRYLLLGKGEEKSGGREKDSNLANAVEAVIGALYLDAGFEAAKAWVLQRLEPYFAPALSGYLCYDHKSALLEWAQAQTRQRLISFAIVKEEGPVHLRRFTAEVRCDNVPLAQGEGGSKKEAEQAAAEKALQILEEGRNC